MEETAAEREAGTKSFFLFWEGQRNVVNGIVLIFLILMAREGRRGKRGNEEGMRYDEIRGEMEGGGGWRDGWWEMGKGRGGEVLMAQQVWLPLGSRGTRGKSSAEDKERVCV